MNVNLFPRALLLLLALGLSVAGQPEPPAEPPQEDAPPPKVLRPSPLVRASQPPPPRAVLKGNRPERLRLLNGDSLSGKFLGLQNNLLQWRHPSASVMIPFKASDVADLRLAPRTRPQNARTHNSSVKLINGDVLMGDLVELTSEALILDTWYAGRLKLPRSSVAELHPVLTASREVFGMQEDDASGWLFGNYSHAHTKPPKPLGAKRAGPGEQRAQEVVQKVLGQKGNLLWRFDGSGFVSTASGAVVARDDIAYPDKFELGFDLQWAGSTSCYFYLCFLASDIKDGYSGDHYRLQVSSGYFYLYRRTKEGQQPALGRPQLREQMKDKTRMRIVFLVDRLARTMTLVVDGKVIDTYTDSIETPIPNSRGLSFQSSNTAAIRISKISVSNWDGKMPGEKMESDGVEDYIFFNNNDHLQGQIKGIKDSRITVISSALGEVPPVALTKVARMHFAKPKQPAPKSEPGATQAGLAGGGRVTGRFESWAPDKVRLIHPFAGPVEFHPAIFHSLNMNRDKPRPRKQEGLFSK